MVEKNETIETQSKPIGHDRHNYKKTLGDQTHEFGPHAKNFSTQKGRPMEGISKHLRLGVARARSLLEWTRGTSRARTCPASRIFRLVSRASWEEAR